MSGITFCHLYANDRSIAHAFLNDKFLSFSTDPSEPTLSTAPSSIDQMQLVRGGIHKVDAVVHHPGTRDWSFFSGDRYLTVRTVPSGLVERVFPRARRISDGWESLLECGFSSVDAFLPVPRRPAEFFVFSGPAFARIKFIEDGSSVVIQSTRALQDGWPALRSLERVDSAMLHHDHETLAYFFCGSRFMCLRIAEDTRKSEVVQGLCEVTAQWPDLARGLYPRRSKLGGGDGLGSPAVLVTAWNTSSLTVVEHEIHLGDDLGSQDGKLR